MSPDENTATSITNLVFKSMQRRQLYRNTSVNVLRIVFTWCTLLFQISCILCIYVTNFMCMYMICNHEPHWGKKGQ